MINRILYKLGYISIADHKLLVKINQDVDAVRYQELLWASSELRQATQMMYDECVAYNYYPLDCALGEYDKVVGE